MKALDLFCGVGGASWGLHQAGFEVTGVDIAPQPNYPFRFIQADALEVDLSGYDFIWASPPCQGYSHAVTSENSKWVPYSQGKATPRLIEDVRDRLTDTDTPYVIENVMGAREELINPFLLCGTMFGLPIARHRLFESSLPILAPAHPRCSGVAKRYAAEHGIEYRDMSVTGKSRHAGCIERWKDIMRMPWAVRASELAESIPPAYSEFIGQQVHTQLQENA